MSNIKAGQQYNQEYQDEDPRAQNITTKKTITKATETITSRWEKRFTTTKTKRSKKTIWKRGRPAAGTQGARFPTRRWEQGTKTAIFTVINPCPPFILWEIARALKRNIRITVQCIVTFCNCAKSCYLFQQHIVTAKTGLKRNFD
jgi:hypothetical protein